MKAAFRFVGKFSCFWKEDREEKKTRSFQDLSFSLITFLFFFFLGLIKHNSSVYPEREKNLSLAANLAKCVF